jgi:RHS repeat-associated protein
LADLEDLTGAKLIPKLSFLIYDCIDPASGLFARLPKKLQATDNPLYFKDLDENYLKAEVYREIDQPLFGTASFSIGKIKCLKAPKGKGGKEIILCRFYYLKEGKTCYTAVVNCRGLTTVYQMNDQLVEKASLYLNLDGDPFHAAQIPYRTDKISWLKIQQSKLKRIACHEIEGEGRLFLKTSYAYDEKGHVIEQVLTGRLSGKSDQLETYKKSYEYLPDGRLSAILEDNGKRILFHYDAELEHPASVYVADAERIWLRRFYEHDFLNRPILALTDDGSSLDRKDLTGVSLRSLRRSLYSEDLSLLNRREIVQEAIIDETGKELLLHQEMTYISQDGALKRKDIYGEEGYLYSLHTEDGGPWMEARKTANNQLLSHLLLKKTRQGRVLDQLDMLSSLHSISQYDAGGRVIRQEKVFAGGQEGERYEWDPFDVLLKKTDALEQETEWSLDPLGRTSVVLHPFLTLEGGGKKRPFVAYEYDPFGHVVLEKDTLGYLKKTEYNSRGQPLQITYPDGTSESFEYHLDGSLALKRERFGLTVVYQRDLLQRVILESHYLADGSCYRAIKRRYSGFHLLEESDGERLRLYHYDKKGRLALEEEIASSHLKTHYKEFSHGKEVRREKDGHFLSLERQHFDLEGRLLEKLSLDEAQNLLERVNYTYNERGQVICAVTERKGMPLSLEEYRYDGLGRLLLYKDAKGQSTQYNYSLCYDPSLELFFKVEEQISPTGFKQVTEKNHLDQILKQTLYNPFGQCLSVWQGDLDLSGNLTLEKFTSLEYGSAPMMTRRTFGPCNRLESLTLAYGSSKERKETYQFADGLLARTIKPSGISIAYTWNELAQLKTMHSSDGSLAQRLSWDWQKSELSVFDEVQNTHAKQTFDADQGLLEDHLANGLVVSHLIDHKGDKRQLILPDGSSIAYAFKGPLLASLTRLSKEGEALYQHLYQPFDFSKRSFVEELPLGLGQTRYSFDENLALQAIESPFHRDVALERTADGLIAKRLVQHPCQSQVKEYRYDTSKALKEESGRLYPDPSSSFNELHEKCSDSKGTYRYDLDGNLILQKTSQGSIHFRYDALNRLIAAEKKGSWKELYGYDFLDRRMTRQRFIWNGGWISEEETAFFYDQNEEIGSADAHGQIRELKVLGKNQYHALKVPVAIELEERIFIPVLDRQGSVISLLDSSGKPAACYSYTAFGEMEAPFAAGNLCSNPWRYRSKRSDDQTGLVYFGKRYYSPDMGCWTTKDPAGFQDGPNLYAYLRGNPLERSDLQGLCSLQDGYQKGWDWIRSFWLSVDASLNLLVDWFAADAQYVQSVFEHTQMLANYIFGQFTLFLIGYKIDPPEVGIWGEFELSDQLRLTAINGILNSRADCIESVEYISQSMGGTRVHYVYHASQGYTQDLFKCVLAKFGFSTYRSTALADLWLSLSEEMGGIGQGGLIIHFAHSLGGADTLQASRSIPKGLKKMIRIITFGSASLIESDGFESATNYVCRRDIISFVASPINYMRSFWDDSLRVIFLGSFMSFPLVDHCFSNGYYNATCLILGPQFLEEFDLSVH